MPWGRCDDGFWDHLKTLALDERYRSDAIALYWMAISWSNDKLADGVVTMATVRMLGFPKSAADELVRVGLWELGGRAVYHVHDYLKFNKSRAQVLAERQKWADEKAAQRGKSTTESASDIHPDSPDVHGRQQGSNPEMSTPDSTADSTADSRVGARSRAGGGRDAAAPRSPVLPFSSDSRDSRVPSARAKGQNEHDDEARRWLRDHEIDPPASGSTADDTLSRLVEKHGAPTVAATMARLGDLDDANQYVFGARNVLAPIPTAATARNGQRESPHVDTSALERIQAEQARFEETRTPEEIAAEVAAYRKEHPAQPRPPVPTKALES